VLVVGKKLFVVWMILVYIFSIALIVLLKFVFSFFYINQKERKKLSFFCYTNISVLLFI